MMKRFFCLCAILLAWAPAFAQGGFRVENGGLVWQNVYQGSADPATVVINLLATGNFRNIERSEGIITADLRGLNVDYKGAGVKRMSLPIYIPNESFTGFVLIQFKDDRYRVTVKRVVGSGSKLGPTALDDMAIDDSGEISEKFLQNDAKVFHYTFFNLFGNITEPLDDEW